MEEPASPLTWLPSLKDQKPYQCGLCSVMFDINIELVTHVHRHSLTKPYQCGYCKVSYDSNPELTVHVKTHTMMVVRPPIRCTENDVEGVQLIQTCQRAASSPPLPCAAGQPSTDCAEGTGRNAVVPVDCSQGGGRANSVPSLNTCVEEETKTRLEETNSTEEIKCETLSDEDDDGGMDFDIETLKTLADFGVKAEDGTHSRGKDSQGPASQAADFGSVSRGSGKSRPADISPHRSYQCDVCGDAFSVARYVTMHKKRVHEKNAFADDRPFQCPVCKAGFKRTSNLNTHMKLSHERNRNWQAGYEDKPHQCDLCAAGYKTFRGLRDHMRKVHRIQLPRRLTARQAEARIPQVLKQDNESVERGVCEQETESVQKDVSEQETESMLQADVSEQETESILQGDVSEQKTESILQADVCEQETKPKQDVSNGGDGKESGASEPGSEADQGSSLLTKDKGKKPYRCQGCKNVRFQKLSELREHCRTVHGVQLPKRQRKAKKPSDSEVEPGLECSGCQKTFRTADSLRDHFCKPKECTVCQRMLKNKSAYYYHMNTHTGKRQYTCEFCGRIFSRNIYLVQHQNSIHLNRKPYKCDICQKGFSSDSGLYRHKLQHTGEKKYVCDFCGNKFFTMANMKRHSVIHTDLRPFPCITCCKTFKSQSNLIYHMKREHDYKTGKRPVGRPPIHKQHQ